MAALNQIGYQQLTVSTVAVGLTVAVNNTHARRVLIFCGPVGAATTNYVRWRADGVLDPTATVGMPLQVGDYLDLTDPEHGYLEILNTIKFIRDTGAAADATLSIAYFA